MSRNNWHTGALELRLKPTKAPNYDLVNVDRYTIKHLSLRYLFDQEICNIYSPLNDSVIGCFDLDNVCGCASCSSSFVSGIL